MCRNIKTLHNFKPPATEEEIRENQRLNRLQREKEERAYQNDNNSTSSNGQVTQDEDKG